MGYFLPDDPHLLPARKGVKWHDTCSFKPTRDFNADDALFAFERQ
jgi:ABC-type transport system substrate-binding protein